MPIARIMTTIVLLLSFVGPCAAAALDDAFAAFDRGDYRRALQLFHPLADQGDPIAQSSLGIMYGLGQSVPQDYSEAAKWYEKAALQGDPVAQSNLGVMYALGQSVSQDYVLAYMLFNVAAAQGEKIAVNNRDLIAREMTPAQIREAQKLTRESLSRSPELARAHTDVSPYSLAQIPNSSSFARNFGLDPLQATIEEAERKYTVARLQQLQLGTMVDERVNEQLTKLNAKEPGRYVAMTPDQYAAFQKQQQDEDNNPTPNLTDVLPRQFCLSDAELDEALISIWFDKLQTMVDACILKYPNLGTQGLKNVENFNTKYSANIIEHNKLAKDVFETHGIGTTQREQTYKQAENLIINLVKTYSEKQCHNVISALQGFIIMDFAGVKMMAHADFHSARASIPACFGRDNINPASRYATQALSWAYVQLAARAVTGVDLE